MHLQAFCSEGLIFVSCRVLKLDSADVGVMHAVTRNRRGYRVSDIYLDITFIDPFRKFLVTERSFVSLIFFLEFFICFIIL